MGKRGRIAAGRRCNPRVPRLSTRGSGTRSAATTWTFADPARPVVVVDETPLGLFAEIEGADAAVRALAAELGVAEADFIAESYVALYQLAERGKDPRYPRTWCFRNDLIAFVLAAGFGTRFRPATFATPKPLLPLGGRPILFRLFDHLLEQGADRFVVNVHHLAEALRTAVGDSYAGVPARLVGRTDDPRHGGRHPMRVRARSPRRELPRRER